MQKKVWFRRVTRKRPDTLRRPCRVRDLCEELQVVRTLGWRDPGRGQERGAAAEL